MGREMNDNKTIEFGAITADSGWTRCLFYVEPIDDYRDGNDL